MVQLSLVVLGGMGGGFRVVYFRSASPSTQAHGDTIIIRAQVVQNIAL